MWNNYGATVPQPQPSVQVCSMVVRVPSEQEGRAFLVQRGLTQIMTNIDDTELYAKTVLPDGRECFEKFKRQPPTQENPQYLTQADVDSRIMAALASLGLTQKQEDKGNE
jgi:hypothetical protein